MKILMTAALAGLFALPVNADSIDKMNDHIDQTNFIVNKGCSGTLIDLTQRLVLTNYHCIDDKVRTEKRDVLNKDGELVEKKYERLEFVNLEQKTYRKFRVVSAGTWVSEIVAKDDMLDLALLQINAEIIPMTQAAGLAAEDPRRGDSVFMVGNPIGLDASIGAGIMSSVNRFVDVGGTEKAFYQVDAGVTGGNSGGALYNDDMELIGVPAAAWQGTVVGLAIPLPTIKEFLTANCFASVFDSEADSHEVCMDPPEEDEADADED